MILALATELAQVVLPRGSVDFPAVWPPAGLLLGALVAVDRRQWLWPIGLTVAIVGMSALAHDAWPLQALVTALTTAVQGSVGAWLLLRYRPSGFTLNRVGDAFGLVGVAFAVSVVGAVAPALAGRADVSIAWRVWALSAALGIVLFTPLLIAWRTEWDARREVFTTLRIIELAIAVAAAAVVAQLVFGAMVPRVFQFPAFMLPFFIWGAFRFGPAGNSLMMLVICLVGGAHTMTGAGPLAMPQIDLSILRGQAASALAAYSFLLLASVVAERRETELDRNRLVAELQGALAEIKTLRGLIPICAWCHKVRDDADVWQRLETYLDANTDATFSHSICPSCVEKQHAAEHPAAQPWKI